MYSSRPDHRSAGNDGSSADIDPQSMGSKILDQPKLDDLNPGERAHTGMDNLDLAVGVHERDCSVVKVRTDAVMTQIASSNVLALLPSMHFVPRASPSIVGTCRRLASLSVGATMQRDAESFYEFTNDCLHRAQVVFAQVGREEQSQTSGNKEMIQVRGD